MFDYKTAERGPWQDGSTVPPVPGIYERKYHSGNFFSCWTGIYWHPYGETPEIARQIQLSNKNIPAFCQTLLWRGLLNKPECDIPHHPV